MTAPDHGYHMTPDEFQRWGHAVVDWIAEYQRRVHQFPVLSRAKPGDIRAALPDAPPQHGESFDHILADCERILLPGITHWQSPHFHAYFPANNSGPSILGELLAAGLGVQGMLWTTSPACTELETHVLDWLVDLLDLPPAFKSSGPGGGVLQDSASSATLCALLAARERASNFQTDRLGGNGQLVAYASAHAHSSFEKAARIAGLGRDNLRLVPVDDHCALRPEALAQMIRDDRTAGRTPCFVGATLGTTSSLAFDPLPDIGRICRQENLWLHVDGAMAGPAALCPEFRHLQHGLECADSYCFNPHKWLFTNFDCDCFYVANRATLIRTLSVLPEYLRNQATESGAVFDYRDWQVPLGRRFRALKLWFVLRHYGVEGLQYHLRQHVAAARDFASAVAADPQFELAAPVTLTLVCFRHRHGDAFNQRLLAALNASGRLFLSHTRLADQFTLRFCVGQTWTTPAHVRAAWDLIRSTCRSLEAAPAP